MQLREDVGVLRGARAVRRVLRIRDVSALVGKYLMRYGTRTLVPAAALSFTLLLGNRALGGGAPKGLPFTPLAISTVLIVTGVSLRILPALFTNQRILSVEARGFNNLENWRKSRLDSILKVLWERVFRYEAAIEHDPEAVAAEEEEISRRMVEFEENWNRFPDDLRNWLGDPPAREVARRVASLRALGSGVEATGEGFRIDATHAVVEPVSETSGLAATGYDLSLLEDYLDGAPLRIGDDKLREHFLAHPLLVRARKRSAKGFRLPSELRAGRLARVSGIWYWIQQKNRDLLCATWRKAVCREVMLATANAIRRIEMDFPGVLITAQSLLRPGDASNAYHSRFPGLPERLEQEGSLVFQRVFGPTAEEALLTFERFGLRSLVRSTRLRAEYDPDYVAGILEDSLYGDVLAFGVKDAVLAVVENTAASVRERLNRLEASESYRSGARSERLAARVACHLGWFEPSGYGDREKRRVIEGEATLRSELRAVRFHQALAKVEIEEHRELILRAYPE